MDALLSAPAGVALLIDGHELSSIHVGFPGRRVPRRTEEVHLLFGEGSELQLLRNVDLDEVSHRLEQEVDSAEALQLALILLDPEASVDIRQEAAVELEDYLGRDGCRERLERVLYAHPLPEDGDLDGALAHSKNRAPAVHQLLRDFDALQPAIEEVRRAWLAVPGSLFESEADRRRFQAAAVRVGLFQGFVLARGEGASIDPLLLDALLKLAIHDIEGHREVLLAWVAPFRKWGVAAEVAETATRLPRAEEAIERIWGGQTDSIAAMQFREKARVLEGFFGQAFDSLSDHDRTLLIDMYDLGRIGIDKRGASPTFSTETSRMLAQHRARKRFVRELESLLAAAQAANPQADWIPSVRRLVSGSPVDQEIELLLGALKAYRL